MEETGIGTPPGVLTVKEALGVLNGIIKPIPIIVTGEVAEANLNQGKFWFFTLRDADGDAGMSCFMMSFKAPFPLENGMKVLISGNFGVYEKSGRLSLTVNQLRASGEGALARAFELLKQKLQKEGLTSEERKRPLPAFVETIAVVSSADAAGFGDFVRVARLRFPGVRLMHIPTSVQGKNAESEIIAALQKAQGVRGVDAIALIRGGGSMDDLHAFNSEPVARAIADSAIPVVVGVGHERDVTIADLVADIRASTPSNAAEILCIDASVYVQQIVQARHYRARAIQVRYETLQTKLMTLRSFRLTALQRRFEMLIEFLRTTRQQRLQAMRHRVEVLMLTTKALMASVEALAPGQVLKRGYALARGSAGAITSAKAFPKDPVSLVFSDGEVHVVKQ